MATVDKEIVQVKYSMVAGQYGGQLIYPSDWMLADIAKEAMSMPSEADLYVATAGQHYPIGTQLRKNGKLYRYSKAGEAMTQMGFLKCNYTICPGSGGNSAGYGFEGAFYADVAAAATSFRIADTAATKNLYEGAHLVIYDETNGFQNYTILGNDASNGTTTTCYIAPPGFKFAETGVAGTGWGITIYLNPYANVRQFATGLGYASALGLCGIASITSAYYFWLQTAGLISGWTFDSGYTGGIIQYGRDIFANTDGSTYGQAATARYYQKIGYILSRTASNYADNFVMLQLDQ
jgi:hypothetical protein